MGLAIEARSSAASSALSSRRASGCLAIERAVFMLDILAHSNIRIKNIGSCHGHAYLRSMLRAIIGIVLLVAPATAQRWLALAPGSGRCLRSERFCSLTAIFRFAQPTRCWASAPTQSSETALATTFTPFASLIGGILIGVSAVLLMASHGRIAGISGIVSRLFPPYVGSTNSPDASPSLSAFSPPPSSSPSPPGPRSFRPFRATFL